MQTFRNLIEDSSSNYKIRAATFRKWMEEKQYEYEFVLSKAIYTINDERNKTIATYNKKTLMLNTTNKDILNNSILKSEIK